MEMSEVRCGMLVKPMDCTYLPNTTFLILADRYVTSSKNKRLVGLVDLNGRVVATWHVACLHPVSEVWDSYAVAKAEAVFATAILTGTAEVGPNV